MSRRTRTMAVLLSSAALAGSGPSLAQAHDGGRGDKHGGHHGHHWRGHHDRGLARTAAKLGVTKDQLKTAMKAVREQQQAASQAGLRTRISSRSSSA